ncbi:MAG: plasmid mobilization relaxosome protein MobC [Rhizobiaceae bacterium]|nr:plasmid mobilization relaxosome protein MobC [Rhizobiaceae bacterium]
MTYSDDTHAAGPSRDRPEAKPFSIRLTDKEKQRLLARAGRLPLGTYIRDLILRGEAQTTRRRWTTPLKGQTALAGVLAALGQSRIANNLNQLAKAANMGALPVTEETEAEISEACIAVSAMRRDLIVALGLNESGRA